MTGRVAKVLLPFALTTCIFVSCSSPPPPATEIRNEMMKCTEARIEIMSPELGVRKQVLRNRGDIERLAGLLEFQGKPKRVSKGKAASTSYIAVELVSRGHPGVTFLVFDSVLVYGPEEEFVANLTTREFYATVKELARSWRAH